MKLSELAQNISITVVRDGSFESVGMVNHTTPNLLVFLDHDRFLPLLRENPQISCVITNKALSKAVPQPCALACAENPKKAFYQLHNHLAEKTNFYSLHHRTTVSSRAEIAPTAYIAPDGVTIAENVVIEPGVRVLQGSIIDEGVILRAGCTIGSQGFEFKRIDDQILPVAHVGGVQLNKNVEVQANSVIDRAIFGGVTKIGSDTKIDSLVHIAHNVTIGDRCLIAGASMISGSVTIGDDVWIGPRVVVSNGVHVGDQATITLGAVVVNDVNAGQKVTGNFAVEHGKFLKAWYRILKEKNFVTTNM